MLERGSIPASHALCTDETARLAALRRYEILDTPAEQPFDDLARLAASVCRTPIALISFVDETRQWFKARLGFSQTETPREVSFCAHAIRQSDVFLVPDTRRDSRFTGNPFVNSSPGARFYAGAPLITPDGFALGALCVIDNVPRGITPDQADALRVLAGRVVAELELRRTRAELARASEERERTEKALRRYAERLEILHELDKAVLSVRSPEAVAQATLHRIEHLIHCHWACVTRFDSKGRKGTVLAVYGSGQSIVNAGTRMPLKALGFGPLNESRQAGFQLVGELLGLNPRSLLVKVLHAEGLRTFVAVPLLSHGEVIGALTLASKNPGAFTPDDLEIAGEEADSLAVAIQQAGLFEQVRTGRRQLETLSRQLMQAQEDERRHIARELHDEIGQALTAVKLNLQSLGTIAEMPSLMPQVQDSIRVVERAMQQVSDLSIDLRPSLLDDLGLIPALRWHVDRLTQRSDLETHFHAGEFEKRLPPEIETACFRVAQEALTNVVRHAQASKVHVELLPQEGKARLVVRDDGIGFDARAAKRRATRGGSLGLLSMEERVLLAGGQIEIKSTPRQGTEIRAHFPLG